MPNVGFCMVNPQPEITPGHVVQVARKCEEIGLHSMWALDRVVYDNLEPLTLLSAAAAATSKIRLGTSVLLAALRPPALLAKSVATLDFISDGRFTLGIGFGSRPHDLTSPRPPRGHPRRGAGENQEAAGAGRERHAKGKIFPAGDRARRPAAGEKAASADLDR